MSVTELHPKKAPVKRGQADEPVTLRCRNILGMCCPACHDESDDGGERLRTLIGDFGFIAARVCCHKLAEAKRRVARPPMQRSASLSSPVGKCYR